MRAVYLDQRRPTVVTVIDIYPGREDDVTACQLRVFRCSSVLLRVGIRLGR